MRQLVLLWLLRLIPNTIGRHESVLILHTDCISLPVLEESSKLNFGVAEKTILPHAVLYFSTADGDFTSRRWFVDLVRKFVSDLSRPQNDRFYRKLDELFRIIDRDVSLIVFTTSLRGNNEPKSNSTKTHVLSVGTRKMAIVEYETVTDPIERLENESEELRELGVDIIIALGLSGNADVSERIARIPLVDVVVNSDGEFWVKRGLTPRKIESGKDESGGRLSVLRITFDGHGNVEEYETDSLAPMMIEEGGLRRMKRAETNFKVYIPAEVDAQSCHKAECAFGNVVADSMAFYMRRYHPHRDFVSQYSLAMYYAKEYTGFSNIQKGEYEGEKLLDVFVNLESTVCLCKKNGKQIHKFLQKTTGASKEQVHISGAFVWWTQDRKRSYFTVRCQDCPQSVFEPVKNIDYGVIGTKGVLDLLGCRTHCTEVPDLQSKFFISIYFTCFFSYNESLPILSNRIACLKNEDSITSFLNGFNIKLTEIKFRLLLQPSYNYF